MNDSGPGLSGCVVNKIISEPTQSGLTKCVADFLAGGATGGFVSCGDDASADDANYGAGGGQTGAGVNFLGPGDGCTGDQADAAVFVFNYASADVPAAPGATAGWIDSSGVAAGATPNCTQASAGQPSVQQFGCKDASGDTCIVWTSVYTAPPGTATNTCSKFA